MGFNPDQPRDKNGEWAGGAGGKASAISHQDGIQKIGRFELNTPALRSLQEAVNRGAFNVTVEKEKLDNYGETRQTFGMVPTIPKTWQAEVRDDGRVKGYYDPSVATLVRDKDYPSLTSVQPNKGTTLSLPEKAEPGMIYRGMSFDEFQDAIKNGAIKSRADYNIGDSEKGLTFFSKSPTQAEAYANGFAPWQYSATPDRPAVVVAIKDPGGHAPLPHQGHDTDEIGMSGAIPTKAIDHVFIGRPYYVRKGEFDVYKDSFGTHQGGGSSPTANVVWKKVKMKAV